MSHLRSYVIPQAFLLVLLTEPGSTPSYYPVSKGVALAPAKRQGQQWELRSFFPLSNNIRGRIAVNLLHNQRI